MADRDDNTEQVIETLNDLIQITHDSHEGYRKAAEEARAGDLKSFFADLADERGAMVRDLQTRVAELGGVPAAGGTTLGSAHRLFTDLKSALMGHDRAAILTEVERGEGEAVRRFERAMDAKLPSEDAGLVQRHLSRLRADKDRIIRMKAAA